MRVVESNGVIRSKATPGLPSAVASPNLRREVAYSTAGMGVRCLDLSTKYSVRASNGAGDAGDGKEKTSSYVGIGAASVQERQGGRTGEGKAADSR